MGIRYEYTRMGRPIRVRDKYAYGTEHMHKRLLIVSWCSSVAIRSDCNG